MIIKRAVHPAADSFLSSQGIVLNFRGPIVLFYYQGGIIMGSKPIGISGSRAATILGLNDWQSEFELWQRIMEEREPGFNSLQGYVLPADPDNASIRWGSAFEDSIIMLAEEKAGKKIINREKLYALKNIAWSYITCHIDGMYIDSLGYLDTLHEGKTTSYFQFRNEWGTPETDKVPAYVQCQVQHQLLCTGAEKCIVSVLVFPKRPDEWEKEGWHFHYNLEKQNNYKLHNDKINLADTINPIHWAITLDQMGYFHQYEITANKELHKTMIKKYKTWWKKHVIKKQEPVPTKTDDIKRLFPEPIGTIITSENIESLCNEYKQIGKEISNTGRLGKRRESLKVKILDWMRKQDSTLDDDSREKTILRDRTGKKIVSWNGKAFR